MAKNIKLRDGDGQIKTYTGVTAIKAPGTTEGTTETFYAVSGTANITGTAAVDVKDKEFAQVSSSTLLAANIKNGVDILGTVGTYTSDATATAATIRSGYTAYVKGTKLNGSLATYSGSSSITPTTSNQTLYTNGYYLNKNITIAGSSNLIAGNIKQGITIFNVTGTYSGGSTNPVYTPNTLEIYPVNKDSSGSWNSPFPTQKFMFNYGWGASNEPYTIRINSETYKDIHNNEEASSYSEPDISTTKKITTFSLDLLDTTGNSWFKNVSADWSSSSKKYIIDDFSSCNIWGAFSSGESLYESQKYYYALPTAGKAGKTSMTVTSSRPGYTESSATFEYYCAKVSGNIYITQGESMSSIGDKLTYFWFQPLHKYGIYNYGSEQTYYESNGFKQATIKNNSTTNTFNIEHTSSYWFNSQPSKTMYSGEYRFSNGQTATQTYPIATSEDATLKFCTVANSTYQWPADTITLKTSSSIAWLLDGEQKSTGTSYIIPNTKKLSKITMNAEGTQVNVELTKTGSGEYTTTFSSTTAYSSSGTLSIYGEKATSGSWSVNYTAGDTDTIYFDKGDSMTFTYSNSEGGGSYLRVLINNSVVYDGPGDYGYPLDCSLYKPTAITYTDDIGTGIVNITADIFPIGEGANTQSFSYDISGEQGSSHEGTLYFNCNAWSQSSQSLTFSGGTGSFNVKYDTGDTIIISTDEYEYSRLFNTIVVNETYSQGTSFTWDTNMFTMNTISLSSSYYGYWNGRLQITGSWADIGTGSATSTLAVSGLYDSESLIIGSTNVPNGYSGNLKYNAGDTINFMDYESFDVYIGGNLVQSSTSSYSLDTATTAPTKIEFYGRNGSMYMMQLRINCTE